MVANPTPPVGPLAWKVFWGKWGFAKDDHLPDAVVAVHPLFCHMVDVAVVARALWEEVCTPASRQALAGGLGLPTEDAAGRWVDFFAGSHDVGKATLAFGLQKPRAAGPLRAVGLRSVPAVAEMDRKQQPHGLATAVLLPPLLGELGLPKLVALRVGDLLGGHHGLFPARDAHGCISLQERKDPRASAARRDLLVALLDTLGVPRDTPPTSLDTATALLLAGLTSVADWIGSNTAFFPYQARLSTLGYEPGDPARYAAQATQQARLALRELGWTRHRSTGASGVHRTPSGATPPPRDGRARFRALFGGLEPLPVQRTIIEVADSLRDGGLAIIEAPMGEGKTEAALYLAAAWLEGGRARGAYFALPTQATSNQMFGRVREFLARLLPASGVELQLLHGHAALSAEFARLRQHGSIFRVENVHGEESPTRSAPPDVVASEWFTYRKRGLLAPYGVGTIDQALLGALVTKHVFVRLFGLSDKVVIVDEVHAYDVYTSDLLKRLLTWLGALRSPVVLLSATLPAQKRRELAAAYAQGAGWAEPTDREEPYPRVTWASAAGTDERRVETSERSRKTLRLRWMDGRRPGDGGGGYPLGEALADALKDGGCAAVLCNTVASAQQTYRDLRRFFGEHGSDGHFNPRLATDGAPELDLLHARFPFVERQRRELRARRRFGPLDGVVPLAAGDGAEDAATEPVRRPHRAILVATQVIEQSLDLDFDLMVSELAPVDLLLQRSGRLHRHPRNNRPAGSEKPELWLLAPEVAADMPHFDAGSTAVYAEHVLLRSWLALRARTGADEALALAVPDQVSELIEEVYGDRELPAGPAALVQAWQRSHAALQHRDEKLTHQASVRLLDRPDADPARPLAGYTSEAVEEEAVQLHPRFQALTRWGPPTVTVVVLYRQDAGYSLEPGGRHPVDPERKPRDLEEVKALLRGSIPVSSQRLAPSLLRQPVPRGWQESPLLSQCRYLPLDPAHRSAPVGQVQVRLDPDEGLVIEVPDEEEERE